MRTAGMVVGGRMRAALFGRRNFVTQRAALAAATSSGSSFALEFTDGTKMEVPAVYVRDSCRCPDCFHPSTLQRRVNVFKHTTLPETLKVNDGSLLVTWQGGHQTQLSADWLLDHTRQRSQQFESWTAPWMHSNLAKVTFGFEDVIEDDSTCRAWLQSFKKFGFARLVGAPLQTGQVARLSQSIGVPMRTTIYGEGGQQVFQVSAKPDPNNQAYTPDALPLHTDLPFYASPPGSQLLHFIRQEPGAGSSTFCDGMAVADHLRDVDYKAWKLLTTVPVVFEDIDPSVPPRYHLEASHPVLEVDPVSNKCLAIHFNNGVRSAIWGTTDPNIIDAHYKATELLESLMNSDKFLFKMEAEPGTVWAFNNRRVLHGREAMSSLSPRMLEGCYFEWDDIDSKIRLLSSAH